MATVSFDNWIVSPAHFPERSVLGTLCDRVVAFIKEFFAILVIVIKRIINFVWTYPVYHLLGRDFTWKAESEGLYLLIHGLRDSPTTWSKHISMIEKEHPGADVIAPYVTKKGNCALKEAAEPILQLVQRYRKEHPEKRICILAHSNGGRIAAYVKEHIPDTAATIKVSAVASPFFGTKWANVSSYIPFYGQFTDSKLIEEVKWGSEHAKKVVQWIQVASPGTYEFYASREDQVIIPWNSCFPYVQGEEAYHLLSGEGHASLLNRVRKRQVRSCITWMKSRQISIIAA